MGGVCQSVEPEEQAGLAEPENLTRVELQLTCSEVQLVLHALMRKWDSFNSRLRDTKCRDQCNSGLSGGRGNGASMAMFVTMIIAGLATLV
jgi:hypothetical protein